MRPPSWRGLDAEAATSPWMARASNTPSRSRSSNGARSCVVMLGSLSCAKRKGATHRRPYSIAPQRGRLLVVRSLRRGVCSRGRRRRIHTVDEVEDMRATGDGVVEVKRDLRRVAHRQALRQLVSQKATRVFERFDALALLLRLAHDADVDFGVAQIGGDLDMGDAGEPEAWILHPGAHEVAQLLADDLGELVLTFVAAHAFPPIRRGGTPETAHPRGPAAIPLRDSICRPGPATQAGRSRLQ